MAIEAYNSTVPSVQFTNGGAGGWVSGNFNQSGTYYNPINYLEQFAPKLTIYDIGINDWDTSVSVATYKTNVQAIITAAKTVGDIILVTPIPSNPSFASIPNATQQLYVAALYQLAATNNVPLIDNFSRWQSYAVSNSVGFYYDSLHGNALGYNDFANPISTLFSNL